MENLIIRDRIVHYCLLWGILNPDLWAQKNNRLRTVKDRTEFRRKLQAVIHNYGISYCCEDQAVFVAENSDGTFEILEGVVLSQTEMQIGDDILIADRERERVLLKGESLWQSTKDGWIPARCKEIQTPKKEVSHHLDDLKKYGQSRLEEQQRLLDEIHARKAKLAPLLIVDCEKQGV
jgi:hypothetical protein